MVFSQKRNGLRDKHFNESVGIANQNLLLRKRSNRVKVLIVRSRPLSVVQKNQVISNNSVPSLFGTHTEKTNIGHRIFLNGAYHQRIYILNALMLRRNVPLLYSIISKSRIVIQIHFVIEVFMSMELHQIWGIVCSGKGDSM